jgi:hypothetical protein
LVFQLPIVVAFGDGDNFFIFVFINIIGKIKIFIMQQKIFPNLGPTKIKYGAYLMFWCYCCSLNSSQIAP